MEIRKASRSDLPEIQNIYQIARTFMAEHGNPSQWDHGYPCEEDILHDIDLGITYVMEQNCEIHGVFVFFIGDEPTYEIIEQGAWNRNQPYGTIHKVASSGKIRGVTKTCFDFCSARISYLRIDTHRDNLPMQSALQKYGFRRCGIIHVHNEERLAYDYLAGNFA